MSKFNTRSVRASGVSPVISETTPTLATYEGAPGYARDAKGELFLLAVTNMVSESTFYEPGHERDSRYARLVRQVAAEDYGWLAGFLPWLRDTANMRSAPLVAAAEAARTRPGCRALIAAVCQRADEPGELLAYWLAAYGKPVPIGVKRGLADAIVRLYTERSLLKYDSREAGLRFGDVIELTCPRTHHPEVRGTWRDDLYKHAIDRRHNHVGEISERLPLIRSGKPVTWEARSADGPVDWAAAIPDMGYMALLRNLRNFDQGQLDARLLDQVAAKLADPGEVAASRQFPLRFLSAYRAAPSLRWSWPLEQALNHSLASIPALPGRTLILVDRSGSMFDRLSARSELQRADAAALFGTALAYRCESADLAEFGSDSRPVAGVKGESLLKTIGRFGNLGGTNTANAVRRWYDGHDRLVILTDEQAWGGYDGEEPTRFVPAHVPVYTFNLAGYKAGHGPSGTANRHVFGGLTDACFSLIPMLEAGQRAEWPWLAH